MQKLKTMGEDLRRESESLKGTLPSNCVRGSVIWFLTIEDNSGDEIHRCLCTIYGEENVINLNVQWWLLMFWEERTNIYDECKGWPIKQLDETVWCVHVSRKQLLLFHNYWHAIRGSSTLFRRSWRGKNSSCITTAEDAKNFQTLGFLTTRERTLKKLQWSDTQLPYSHRNIINCLDTNRLAKLCVWWVIVRKITHYSTVWGVHSH